MPHHARSNSRRVPYSPNVLSILENATKQAILRRHQVVGTEHVVYSFCENKCARALLWIASTLYPSVDKQEAVKKTAEVIIEWLEGRDEFQPLPRITSLPESASLKYSRALETSLRIAERIGSGPVRDGDMVIEGGLMATEFLLAGIIVEGSGIGASALTRCSRGKINSCSILNAIQVHPDAYLNPSTATAEEKCCWGVHFVPPVRGDADARAGDSSWYPSYPLSEVRSRCIAAAAAPESTKNFTGAAGGGGVRDDEDLFRTSVTNSSNWVIPGRLCIGEHPSAEDALSLAHEGRVGVFVSLIGEYCFAEYIKYRYPGAFSASTASSLRFMHFPIRDFEVAEAESLVRLVNELRILLFSGHVLFIHCRGGHGRTGMVVVPLVSAVYDCPVAESKSWVEYSTRNYRASDRRWADHVHMPETKEQEDIINGVEMQVRKHKR